MKFELNLNNYVDWIVYQPTKIKGKYGFRIVLIFENGDKKQQQESGFSTISEANKARDKVVAQLYAGTYVTYTKVKVKDYLEYWLDYKRPMVSDNTYNSYRNVIQNYINIVIGNLYMTSLNSSHIRKVYNKVAENSCSVASLTKTVLKVSMQFAVGKKIIERNTAEGVDLPKCVEKKKLENSKCVEKKKQTLNVEQIKTLIIESKGTPIYLHILFSVLMGLRKSEINGLKYSDIDHIKRKIKVMRQLGKKPCSKKEDFQGKSLTKQEIKLKTRSSYRELEIPDIVYEAIIDARKLYEAQRKRRINDKNNPFQDLDYICCSTYGKPRSRGFVYNYYQELLKKCQLPDITWHKLRTTYCTLLAKNDFTLKAISRLLGHSKEIISADVYCDKKAIIIDCLDVLEPYIQRVIPKAHDGVFDYSNEIDTALIIDKYYQELIVS